MNRDELLMYVGGLSAEVAGWFHAADRAVIEASDTLSEEFQLAAAVVALFEGRAEQRRDREAA